MLLELVDRLRLTVFATEMEAVAHAGILSELINKEAPLDVPATNGPIVLKRCFPNHVPPESACNNKDQTISVFRAKQSY